MKRFASLLLAVLLSLPVFAQLLWKVSGNGLGRPSYLLATHHVAPAGMLDSIAGFASALDSVSTVYGEMDMGAAMSPEGQMALSAYMTAPADSTLDKLLSPARVDTLSHAMMEILGYPTPPDIRMIGPVKPAVVSNLLSMALSAKLFEGFSPDGQIDAQVQKRAADRGKSVKGLETMTEQAAMIFGVPVSTQAEELMQLVRDLDLARSLTVRIALAYTDQNLDEIEKVMGEESALSPAANERLLSARNRRWIDELIPAMQAGPVLVAVGAAHLPGPGGLIALLRAQGYTVSPA